MTITNGNSQNMAGIHVHREGLGAARIAIQNNHVSQADHYGIWVSFGSNSSSPNIGAQSADITVTGNTVDFTGVIEISGVQVDSGLLSADTTSMCAHIAMNTITQPNDADIRVRNRMAVTSFRMPGYTGSATNMTAVLHAWRARVHGYRFPHRQHDRRVQHLDRAARAVAASGERMTRRVTADAVRAGCDVSILQSSEMAKSIYERLGYRSVVEYMGYVEP